MIKLENIWSLSPTLNKDRDENIVAPIEQILNSIKNEKILFINLRFLLEQIIKDFCVRTNQGKIIDKNIEELSNLNQKIRSEKEIKNHQDVKTLINKWYIQISKKINNEIQKIKESNKSKKRQLKNRNQKLKDIKESINKEIESQVNQANNKELINIVNEIFNNEIELIILKNIQNARLSDWFKKISKKEGMAEFINLANEIHHGRNYKIYNNKKIYIDKFNNFINSINKEWWESSFYLSQNKTKIYHIIQNNELWCISGANIIKKKIAFKEKLKFQIKDFYKLENIYYDDKAKYCILLKNNEYHICSSCIFRICGFLFYEEYAEKINIINVKNFFFKNKKILKK